MRSCTFFTAFLTCVIVTVSSNDFDTLYTTAQRIASFNYPVETHNVVTSDGYNLTIFRIPYSQKSVKIENTTRPVAFLQHGFVSSSDCWILNGPDNALAYLFADAGFDVWMGNNRGNTYSRQNVNISSDDSEFWQFEFEELAVKDLPVMIDYVLQETNQDQLHYVGHSQGTTIFFVLMSEIPSYNTKIKTAHMLAPVAYFGHGRSPIFLFSPLLGHPSIFSEVFDGHELLPLFEPFTILESVACADGSLFQFACADLLFFLVGPSKHLNYTLLPQFYETHPAGSSTGQVTHFYQVYISKKFRKFDYGRKRNNEIYGQNSPPNYDIKKIVAPIRNYYGDQDFFSVPADVKHLEAQLPNLVESYYVPVKGWNHLDFYIALDVKELINDKIISSAISFEKTGQQ